MSSAVKRTPRYKVLAVIWERETSLFILNTMTQEAPFAYITSAAKAT